MRLVELMLPTYLQLALVFQKLVVTQEQPLHFKLIVASQQVLGLFSSSAQTQLVIGMCGTQHEVLLQAMTLTCY